MIVLDKFCYGEMQENLVIEFCEISICWNIRKLISRHNYFYDRYHSLYSAI